MLPRIATRPPAANGPSPSPQVRSSGRTERHRVDGNVGPGFDFQHRGRAAQHGLERPGGADRSRLRRGTLDEKRHFVSRRIGEAKIFQRRSQGVECGGRQRDFDKPWRGNLNRLSLLPFAERRGKMRLQGSAANHLSR